ncbi:MAG TPA: polysaccharide deacetylase family protein [Pseudonocardia sp.]|uniref:polysaccharide deacetylase family protein n=1 Tax=Pseudonocardia sp. TaxID=60912 RepID=UPI002ED969BF
MTCPHQRWGRRAFLGLLGVGFAVAAAGCAAAAPGSPRDASGSAAPSGPPQAPPGGWPAPRPITPRPPVNRPNGVVELHAGPAASVPARQLALTVDDGFCDHCVAGYAAFARRTGVHLTFSPNGRYASAWAPQAPVLRPLIEAGQVQLMNHTFNHPDLTKLGPSAIRAELERNEKWIAATFRTSTRPYFRPPFGRRNLAVVETAGEVGFNRVVMWDGSYSDSKLITPQFLMAQAHRYLQAGVIMLGHANHPTVLGLFDEILELIKQRELTPVTLDEMFRTQRPPVTS